jgi:hypothetical protein
MAHIQLPEGLPGIRGPMVLSPETTKPLCDLVQVLLTGPRPEDQSFVPIGYLRQLWPRRFCGPIVGQNSRRGYGRAIFMEYPLGCHSGSVHA